MIVLLVVMALLLQRLSYALDSSGPSVKDAHDIATVLHRDDAHLVLFVHPDEEVFVGRALDAPGFRPVARTPADRQQGTASGLLEERPHFAQFFRQLFVHGAQRLLSARQISGQLPERILEQVFHLEAILPAGSRRQRRTRDAPASSDPRGFDVLVDGLHGETERFQM